MKLKKFILSLFLVSIIGISNIFAQDPLVFLRSSYPKLTELYQEELLKYPVHYIFAIDVSGTMKKYANDVQPAMKPFIDALPNGDMVSVIPFGTEPRELVGFSGSIDPVIRGNLKKNIDALYNNTNYDKAMLQHTDIEKAVMAACKKIENYPEYKVNVVVFLTDFRNDVAGITPAERKLDKEQLERMNNYYDAATYNKYTRAVALDLATPDDKLKPGYCLNQLRYDVFPTSGNPLEIVPLTNPGEAISQWFDQLKREIMVTKLKAIVDEENRMNPAEVTTETDIDGNVQAHVKWHPTKLYPKMKIDSTTIKGGDSEGFEFINDTSQFQMTMDSVMDLNLGQLKNKDNFFHSINDSLCLGIDLPTDYDDELHRLQIKKPLPNTTVPEDKMIWTFPLPLWLTTALLLLLILYVLGVINTIGKNNNLAFKGKIFVTDPQGSPIATKPINGQTEFSIGKTTGACSVPDAVWGITVSKIKVNPFLHPYTLFGKPYFEWNGSKFVNKKNNGAGDISGKLIPPSDTTTLFCGESKNNITHKVRIQLSI